MTTGRALVVRRAILALLLAAASASFVGARYPVDLALHHVGTAAGAACLVWADRKWHLSFPSFAAALLFLVAHVVGARYLYSFVPYDAWSEALTGHRLSDVFGWERNHYDRLVHLLYGLLLSLPAFELLRRHLGFSVRAAAFQVVSLVLATSAAYELLEWGLAVTLAPESAERYNGQQGDMWDAQKDIALATLGSIVTLAACLASPLGTRLAPTRDR